MTYLLTSPKFSFLVCSDETLLLVCHCRLLYRGGTSLKILAGIAHQLPAKEAFESHCHGLRQKVVPVFSYLLWSYVTHCGKIGRDIMVC